MTGKPKSEFDFDAEFAADDEFDRLYRPEYVKWKAEREAADKARRQQAQDAADERLRLPFNPAGIDVRRPPGLVGRVAGWIRSQALSPRESLAVGAALFAVGNIGGLRFQDSYTNVTSNLIVFGIATSATGKESIIQAINKIHTAAGINRASASKMKSAQEIYRNLIEHQPIYYVLDEVSALLALVNNAQKKGGTPYLEAIVSVIMDIFTKASSVLNLSGDEGRDLEQAYAKRLAQAERALEEASGVENTAFLQANLDRVKAMMAFVKAKQLPRPFLSLMGFAVPSEFFQYMDVKAASKGFLGRAIICEETDPDPDMIIGRFKKPELPLGLELSLKGLLTGSEYRLDVFQDRIENYGALDLIETPPEVEKFLMDLQLWWRNYGAAMGEIAGYAAEPTYAIIRRANEEMLKIVFILAMGSDDNVKTIDMAKWAFLFVLDDINIKFRMIYAEEHRVSAPNRALAASVLNALPLKDSGEKGKTAAKVANFCKKPIADINKILADLEKSDDVVQVPGKKHNGVPVPNWFKTRQK